jgi:phospholipase/carboxylesterase
VRREDDTPMPDLSLIHRTHPARSGEAPHPGLLLLHGRGADESDLLPLASELDGRLFTVTARAPLSFPWGGYLWYNLDRRGVGFPDAAELAGSLDLLRRFLAEIVEAYPIDPQRLYVGGFSMGATMSASLALLEPERVAGAMVLSGYLPLHAGLPLRPRDAANHPIFLAHGTRDQVIPVSFGRETRDYLAQTPVDLTYREYPAGHEIGSGEFRELASWLTGVLDAGQPSARSSSASHWR